MLVPLPMLVQEVPAVTAAIAEYRAGTTAEVPCRVTNDDDEIVVCARRDADRYRVPFVPPSRQELPDQRVARLVGGRTEPECGKGAFMAHCGFVGASVSVGGRGLKWVKRELAP